MLPSPRIGLPRELAYQGKVIHCCWLGKSFCHPTYVLSWARLALLHLEEIKEGASGMFECLGLPHIKKEVGT